MIQNINRPVIVGVGGGMNNPNKFVTKRLPTGGIKLNPI